MKGNFENKIDRESIRINEMFVKHAELDAKIEAESARVNGFKVGDLYNKIDSESVRVNDIFVKIAKLNAKIDADIVAVD
jgi:hypothetical protein